MKKLKKITALLLAAVLVLSLAACTTQEEKFTVQVDLPEAVNTLDPAMVSNDAERMVVSHLYENLMKLTNDGAGRAVVTNGLAANYTCENHLDGTQTYTFSLRSGITWSDGQPVTAGDFVYAWQRLADPKTESPNAALLSVVKGYAAARKNGDMTKLQVSAPDDRTLVVELSEKCLNFAEVICTSAATMPVRADVLDSEEGGIVANGPYRIVEAWSENSVTLAVGEGYHDTRRLGPDALQFTCGAAEEADFRLTYAGVEDESLWNAAPVPQVGTLVVNQMSSMSEELRQAMSLTIDRVTISELLGSVYVPAEGLVPYGVRNTQDHEFRTAVEALIDNDPEQYESRCEAARALLQGQELPEEGNVSLAYVSDEATDRVAQALQATWQEQLGLTVTLQAMEQADMDKALKKGDFTMALVMMTCEENDAAALMRDWTSKATGNYAHISDKTYDLLMRIVDASTSAEARDAYLYDAERMLLETGLVVPICFVKGDWQMNEEMQGVFSDGYGRFFFTGVTEIEK